MRSDPKIPFSEAYSFHNLKLRKFYVTKKEVFSPFYSHSLGKYFQKGKHMKSFRLLCSSYSEENN